MVEGDNFGRVTLFIGVTSMFRVTTVPSIIARYIHCKLQYYIPLFIFNMPPSPFYCKRERARRKYNRLSLCPIINNALFNAFN